MTVLIPYVIGWVPKAFVSSRSQRSDVGMQQKPEDFMDEEVTAVIIINSFIYSFILGSIAHISEQRWTRHTSAYTCWLSDMVLSTSLIYYSPALVCAIEATQ